jgi:Xaa-Pro aminopeptidase
MIWVRSFASILTIFATLQAHTWPSGRVVNIGAGACCQGVEILSCLNPEDIRVAVGWMRGANVPEVNRRLSQNAINEIKAELEKHGVADMPIAVDEVEMYIVEALQNAGLKIANGYDAMFDARIIKSPDELKIIELSASLVDGVYSQIFDRIKPGVKENEIVGWIYGWLIENGVDRISGVNCVSGPRSNPHPHDYSDRMIRPGDLVFIDIMSHYLGYATCYYRTFAVTRATQNQRDVYKRALDWLQASIDVVRPGVTTADVASVWPTAKELGYEDEAAAFALALGHGIGISHHEKPWISRAYSLDNPVTLEAGMHFALETFYGEGDDGARIESQVIVTEDGNRVITKFPCEELLVCNPIG